MRRRSTGSAAHSAVDGVTSCHLAAILVMRWVKVVGFANASVAGGSAIGVGGESDGRRFGATSVLAHAMPRVEHQADTRSCGGIQKKDTNTANQYRVAGVPVTYVHAPSRPPNG